MHVIFDYLRGKNCLVVEKLFVMQTMVGEADVRLRWRKRDMLGMFSSAFFFVLLQVYISI